MHCTEKLRKKLGKTHFIVDDRIIPTATSDALKKSEVQLVSLNYLGSAFIVIELAYQRR
jgi:hypothetical protein